MGYEIRTTATIAACLLALADSSPAQTQRSGGGETQKILQQYQQLAAEKTSLQAQVAQLKADLEKSKADLTGMKKERDSLKSHSGGSSAALAQATSGRLAAEREVDQSKQRMTELVSRFRDTAQNLKDVEADRSAARRELGERNTAFDVCAENNLQLYEITKETLDRYERVGFFTKVSAAEPFTKISRTRIENLVGEYRTRAQELRVKKPKP